MDFFRMYLAQIVSLLGTTIVFVVIYLIFVQKIRKALEDETNVWVAIKWVYWSAYVLLVVGLAFSMTKTLSVNNVPRNDIDRSFTNQTQQSYESRVLNKTEESEK